MVRIHCRLNQSQPRLFDIWRERARELHVLRVKGKSRKKKQRIPTDDVDALLTNHSLTLSNGSLTERALKHDL